MRATTPSKIGMAPPHPGAFIRDEILDELGLSVSAAAKALGVRRATLSDLLNGNAALSAEMALRVEKAFGVDMETLLRMQAWHDAVAMRRRQIGVKRYRVAVLKLAVRRRSRGGGSSGLRRRSRRGGSSGLRRRKTARSGTRRRIRCSPRPRRRARLSPRKRALGNSIDAGNSPGMRRT
jgi:addiction module HigA family antidote